jgi:hypothetical protein
MPLFSCRRAAVLGHSRDALRLFVVCMPLPSPTRELALLQQVALSLDAGEYRLALTDNGCRLRWEAGSRWVIVTLSMEPGCSPAAGPLAVQRRVGGGWLSMVCRVSDSEDLQLLQAAVRLGEQLLAQCAKTYCARR